MIFFCKYLNFCQRNTIDKDEKIHFFFKLKRQFFLSWELHRSKNRCRSKIYNGKFSHLSFFSFGSYSEFLRNILIHIDCSLSIQRSFWNFSLITCMFILFLIVFFMYYNTNWKKKKWKELFTYMYCFTYSLTSPIIFIEPIR